MLSCTCECSSDIYSVALTNEQGEGKNLVLESNLRSPLSEHPEVAHGHWLSVMVTGCHWLRGI